MSEALEPLIADGVIEAVLGQLKSGKEAEVWLVQHAGEVVAAKVYKERHQRNFANNAGYREGRDVRNSRTRRAMAKGTKFGQAAAEEAWRTAEADSLFKLHALGVRVPTPVMFYEGVLLMELVIDPTGHPAPRLIEAPPQTPEDAHAMYLDLRAQIVAMLSADLIHGDLSPYNILMAWNGPVIIDFPQTIAAARNNNAERYFKRDLENVRTFFAAIDPGLRATHGDAREIWNAYLRRDLSPDYVPSQQATHPQAPKGRTEPAGRRDAPHRDGPRHEGRPRDATRHPAARAPQAPLREEPPVTVPSSPELDPAEAELRALEAMVLKQGGGARSKPPGAGAGADKGGPGHGRGPRRGPPSQGRNGQQSARPANPGPRPPQGARPAQPASGARQGPPPGAQRGPRQGAQPGAVAQQAPSARPPREQQARQGERGGKAQHRGAPDQRSSARPQHESPKASQRPQQRRDGAQPQQAAHAPQAPHQRRGEAPGNRAPKRGAPSGPVVSYVQRPPGR